MIAHSEAVSRLIDANGGAQLRDQADQAAKIAADAEVSYYVHGEEHVMPDFRIVARFEH